MGLFQNMISLSIWIVTESGSTKYLRFLWIHKNTSLKTDELRSKWKCWIIKCFLRITILNHSLKVNHLLMLQFRWNSAGLNITLNISLMHALHLKSHFLICIWWDLGEKRLFWFGLAWFVFFSSQMQYSDVIYTQFRFITVISLLLCIYLTKISHYLTSVWKSTTLWKLTFHNLLLFFPQIAF